MRHGGGGVEEGGPLCSGWRGAPRRPQTTSIIVGLPSLLGQRKSVHTGTSLSSSAGSRRVPGADCERRRTGEPQIPQGLGMLTNVSVRLWRAVLQGGVLHHP